MPQSLAAIYLHLVFSTKGRRSFLTDASRRSSMHAYLGATSRSLDCPPIRIGGTADHVHVLARLGKTQGVSNWIKELKRVTSIWVHQEFDDLGDFAWQSGYGVFSVSASRLPDLVQYVERQEEHHGRISFQDEFRALCRKHGVELDERYAWD